MGIFNISLGKKVLIENDVIFELLFESLPSPMVLLHSDGKMRVNKSFCSLVGFEENELSEIHWEFLTHPEDIEKCSNAFYQLKNRTTDILRIEKRYINKSGGVLWVEELITIHRDSKENPLFYISVVTDLENKKLLEKKAQKSESHFKELFESNPSPMWFYDTETLKILAVNKAAINHYGYSKDEFEAMTIKDIRPAGDVTALLENLRTEKEAEQKSGIWRHKKKNGEIIFVEVSSHAIDFESKAARVVVIKDVTQMREMEQQRSVNEAKFKGIFFNSPDIVALTDIEGKIKDINRVAEGYKIEEVIGTSFGDYLFGNQSEQFKAAVDEAIKTGKQTSFEVTIVTPNGVPIIWFNRISAFFIDNKPSGLVINCTDITNRKMDIDSFKESEEEFRKFFDFDLSGNFISSIDGKILISNKRFREIFGFNSEEEVLNTNVNSIYNNPDDRRLLIEKINKDKKIENFDMEMRRRDGKLIHVVANILGQFNNKGTLERLLGYINDVSEQKHAYEKIKQLSAAIEQSPTSIVITDIEGNIQYANPKCLEINGYSAGELIGKNPRVFKSGDKPSEAYSELWKTIKSGKEWRGEFHNKKKNGELYWEFASISPIKNEKGEIINFLAVKEDITERKKTEQELIAAKEKAEEINRIKSNFFSNMSHELRTPLSGILGFTELLKEEINEPEHKRMLDSIYLSGQRLLETLNKILQISKLESEKPNLKIHKVYLPFFIQLIIAEFKAVIAQKGLFIELNYDEDNLHANIDRELFSSVMTNLLSNAIKFTPSGGITITCKGIVENNMSFIQVDVTDTGIGISEKNQSIIFQEFRQASEGLSRLYEGTGLGLSIVKKYINLMGGTVSVKSKLTRGTTFTIKVPRTDKDQNGLASQGSEVNNAISDTGSSERKKPLILLVEDDNLNSEIVKVYLQNFCDLHIAQSGEAAIEMIKDNKYDAFLMDISLGKGISGLETSKIIRVTPGYENVPIIALTAYAMNGEKEKFLAAGLNSYISKPFKMNELTDALIKLLPQKQ
jgi:PAS domain S-box-containing protein